MMMINLLPLLLNIIVLLILLFFNLFLILTIAGASAARRGNGQPAARRTAAGGAYAGGGNYLIDSIYISVYDTLSVHFVCTLFVYITYHRGGSCVCANNRQGTWPRCRIRRCRCSQKCGRGAKCRNVIPGDPSACVCKCRIRTQNYVNGRSIEKATYDMML